MIFHIHQQIPSLCSYLDRLYVVAVCLSYSTFCRLKLSSASSADYLVYGVPVVVYSA